MEEKFWQGSKKKSFQKNLSREIFFWASFSLRVFCQVEAFFADKMLWKSLGSSSSLHWGSVRSFWRCSALARLLPLCINSQKTGSKNLLNMWVATLLPVVFSSYRNFPLRNDEYFHLQLLLPDNGWINKIVPNKAPSNGTTTLNGTTCPRLKRGGFSQVYVLFFWFKIQQASSGTGAAPYKLMEPYSFVTLPIIEHINLFQVRDHYGVQEWISNWREASSLDNTDSSICVWVQLV